MSQQPRQPRQHGQQQGSGTSTGQYQGSGTTRTRHGSGMGHRMATTGQSPQRQGTASGTGGRRLESQLYGTRNYLPEEVRVEVIRVLNRTLADTTVLMTQAKFAHWNLKGREFVGLHELFDDVAEMLADHADEVAERITALGGQALGTAGQSIANCQVPSIPSDAVTGIEYVGILADQLAIHDAELHRAIDVANGYDDVDTADLLNEVSREVSKQLWFLEAHLQTQPTSTISLSGGGGQSGTGGMQGGGVRGGQPAHQRGMGRQGQTGQQGGMGQQPSTGRQEGYGPYPSGQ